MKSGRHLTKLIKEYKITTTKDTLRQMKPQTFLAQHPVFTTEEMDAFLVARFAKKTNTTSNSSVVEERKSLLSYYRKAGQVLPVRRGLYATVAAHRTPDEQPVDSFLIASRLTPDAVIAYHGALSLHGLAHSLREEIVVLSEQPFVRPLHFRGTTYRAVSPPSDVPLGLGVETWDRQGLAVRVTGLERTVVDCLDRPQLSGGWEEVWHSLEGLDAYLNADLLLEYILKLRTATTAAKVGYFLSQHQERLRIPAMVLETLKAHRPKRAHYILRDRTLGLVAGRSRFVPEWNLMVPSETGEEAYGDILV
jgi:predicted transcriptional regulator of viral defense system